jgi:hypothetical protein
MGHVFLLIHPDKPGAIRIGVSYGNEEDDWGGWEVHRFRFVVDPVLAESLIWRLLGVPRPIGNESTSIELSAAEQAFRDLVGRMHSEIALREKWKELS